MRSLTSNNKITKLEWFAITILTIGGLIAIVAVILFMSNEPDFNKELKINNSKFGDIGSFLSGTVGILWSLASVIYFVLALKEQRKDIKTNQKALELQIEELKESREVSLDQAETFKIQRFENTFFQLLQLQSNTLAEITFNDENRSLNGVKVFQYWKLYLDKISVGDLDQTTSDGAGGTNSFPSPKLENNEDIESYLDKNYKVRYYYYFENSLNHYFRQLYHIYKYVHQSPLIKDEQRKFYAGLIRARLSQNELYAIAVNAIIPSYGYPKFAYLIKKYKVLKNLNSKIIPNDIFVDYIEDKIQGTQNPF